MNLCTRALLGLTLGLSLFTFAPANDGGDGGVNDPLCTFTDWGTVWRSTSSCTPSSGLHVRLWTDCTGCKWEARFRFGRSPNISRRVTVCTPDSPPCDSRWTTSPITFYAQGVAECNTLNRWEMWDDCGGPLHIFEAYCSPCEDDHTG